MLATVTLTLWGLVVLDAALVWIAASDGLYWGIAALLPVLLIAAVIASVAYALRSSRRGRA